MTNAEYFKEQIKELLDNNYKLAVVEGKPVSCTNTDCEMCDLYFKGCYSYGTSKWLASERLEEVTIKASELADDTKVLASYNDDFYSANRRYFAKNLNNKLITYINGTTSWTSAFALNQWKYMWLEDGTRVVEG